MRLFFASILFLFHAHVWASEPGIFLNLPTGGPIHNYTQDPVYKLGETVQLHWTTDLGSFSITLWQNDISKYEVVQYVCPCRRPRISLTIDSIFKRFYYVQVDRVDTT